LLWDIKENVTAIACEMLIKKRLLPSKNIVFRIGKILKPITVLGIATRTNLP